MRKKVLTPQCPSCESLKTHMGKLQCIWGRGTPKLLIPHKGKKRVFCKLFDRGKTDD